MQYQRMLWVLKRLMQGGWGTQILFGVNEHTETTWSLRRPESRECWWLEEHWREGCGHMLQLQTGGDRALGWASRAVVTIPQLRAVKNCRFTGSQTCPTQCIPNNIPNNLLSASDTCAQLNQQNGEYSLKWALVAVVQIIPPSAAKEFPITAASIHLFPALGNSTWLVWG